jgi:hypothetical protein
VSVEIYYHNVSEKWNRGWEENALGMIGTVYMQYMICIVENSRRISFLIRILFFVFSLPAVA